MSNYCECHLSDKCEWCLITEENQRYRKAIEHAKFKLRDFRRDLNTVNRMSRDRTTKREIFSIGSDIRDCIDVLEEYTNE